MLEQRNAFITEMNASFISQKKKLNNILSILQWTPQSIAGTIKEADDMGTSKFTPEVAENDAKMKGIAKESEGSKDLDNIQIMVKDEGTSKDSEKRYNELLASLSFQPKVKQEKLSDTQLLATLLESERNAKRRRISYRNKVHTKNKSHTEVLREVIHEQMEILRDNEETDNNKVSRTSGKLEEEDEMYEVRVMNGNPHLAWQTVGLVVGEQRRERKKSCGFLPQDKINAGHRHERRSSDPVHEKSSSDHRKSNHYDRHDKKHRRSSPYRESSANYRHSKHSRSDRSSRDWDRSSKSSKSSRRHHSKHRHHDR